MEHADNNERWRSVLIVAYYFPPSDSIGARRTEKFVRYMKTHLWQPSVLTTEVSVFGSSINTLSTSCGEDESRVFRTKCWSFTRLSRRIRQFVGTGDTRGDLADASEKSLLVGLKRLIQALMIPDTEIGWLPFAVIEGVLLVRTEKIQVLYASGPPPTALLSAALISILTRKPLIIDLRDSWAICPDWLYLEENQGVLKPLYLLRLLVEKLLERFVFIVSSRIILNTRPMEKVYKRAHRKVAHKMLTITNGYDQADFVERPDEAVEGSPEPGWDGMGTDMDPPLERDRSKALKRFSLVFTGSYYGFHSPDSFLLGLRWFLDANPEFENVLSVFLIGRLETRSTWQLIDHLQLGQTVKIIGQVPHRQSIRYMQNSDALLITLPSVVMTTWWVPAKLYEYLATEKPILAIMPEGAASRLVRARGNGFHVLPDDPSAISTTLFQLIRKGSAKSTMSDLGESGIRQFEYQELTRRLVELFNSTVSEAGSAPNKLL